MGMINKNIQTIFFIVSFVYLFNFNICPQTRISGKVTDAESGEVLISSTIQLFGSSPKSSHPVRGTSTNIYGLFSLPNVKPGSYLLSAQCIGYKTNQTKIEISDTTQNIYLNIQLKSSGIELGEVIVSSKRDSNFSISSVEISPAFLERLPSKGGEIDLFGALQHIPGVTTSSELSNGLYVRGGSPDQTLTMIDGVVIYNPFHLGGFATSFNTDAVKNIKLDKGGFPAEYGGRLSSVLDITLKEGSRSKYSGSAAIGLIGSRANLEGPLSDNASFIIAGRVNYLKNVEPLITNSEVVPLYNFYDLNAKVNYYLSDFDKISIAGFISNDNLGQPKNSQDANYNINWSNATLSLNWLNITSDSKFTKLSLNYTKYNFNTLIQDIVPNSFRQDFYSNSGIQDFTIKGDGSYISTETHSLKTGIEFTFHNFNLINNDYYATALLSDERYITNLNSFEASAYAQDEWRITPLLILNMGIRIYAFPEARYFSPEPRISISYALTDKTFLKAAFATGNQFLHLITRNDVLLPTDMWFPSTTVIKPSNARQYILGIETQSNDGEYLLTVEGYYKEMFNLYEYSDTATFTIEAPIEQQLTRGRGNASGMEIFFNKRTGDLTGWIGYTLAWTRRFFDEINGGQPFYPRYDRRHDISIALVYDLFENVDFGATWTYGTGQAFTMPTGEYYFTGVFANANAQNQNNLFLDYTGRNDYRLPAYHKLDLNLTYKFLWYNLPFDLALNIYNAYNQSNPLGRYLSFENNPATNKPEPVLKQFTLFPFLPTLSIGVKF
jgi:hypothetical protein